MNIILVTAIILCPDAISWLSKYWGLNLLFIWKQRLPFIITISGEGGSFVIFRIFKSIFFVNWISLYFFHFLLNYYHILFIIIVFWLGCDRPAGHLFFRARFAFFHTHASLLTSFVCFFILFHSCCSHAQVFGKTLVLEFPMSYSHTEWYLPFLRGEIVYWPKLRLSKSNLTN